MQATNYFRKINKYVEDVKAMLASGRYKFHDERQIVALNVLVSLVNGFKHAEKFILPEGGRILDDKLKGLEGNANLRLPFPEIVLEFQSKLDSGTGKFAVFAREQTTAAGAGIFIVGVLIADKDGEKDAVAIHPFSGFVFEEVFRKETGVSLKVEMANILTMERVDPNLEEHKLYVNDVSSMLVSPVLELIEALSCKNVTSEYLPHKHNAAKHAALGFDEYRVLTVRTGSTHTKGNASHAGSHASPREHLRRGHIRRHPTAGNLWINSMVVNAGVGGKIHKTYKMEAA